VGAPSAGVIMGPDMWSRGTTIGLCLLVGAMTLTLLAVGLPSDPSAHSTSRAFVDRDFDFFLVVAGNNLKIGLVLLLGLPTCGALALYQLGLVGMVFGIDLARALGQMPTGRVLALCLPHGIPEFVGFAMIASLQFLAASSLFGYLRGRPPPALDWLRLILARGGIGLGLITLGAFIETYVTTPFARWLT
jgi:uncharacterized membrane protein SpoIIM required for sporulation